MKTFLRPAAIALGLLLAGGFAAVTADPPQKPTVAEKPVAADVPLNAPWLTLPDAPKAPEPAPPPPKDVVFALPTDRLYVTESDEKPLVWQNPKGVVKVEVLEGPQTIRTKFFNSTGKLETKKFTKKWVMSVEPVENAKGRVYLTIAPSGVTSEDRGVELTFDVGVDKPNDNNNNNDNNKPLPAGRFGLSAKVRDAALALRSRGRFRDEAIAAAQAYEVGVSQTAALPDATIARLTQNTAAELTSRLNEVAPRAHEDWLPVREKVRDWLKELAGSGRILSIQDHYDAWKELAVGLRAAGDVPSR